LKQIENIVHPLVVRDRQLFIEQAKQAVLVFDIPLLYETHSQHQFDAVACVYISPEEQRRRVMDRGTMTAAQLDYILSKQMPIAKKRELSHYQIKTDSLVHVMAQVSVILADIREQVVDA
jgi:dephospho-CoA kinase